MSSDTELLKLYSGRILALAADMPHTGRLESPDGTARVRSPLCGSTVTVDVVTDNGTVIEYAQDVKACALGQAAASVVGAAIIGQTEDTIREGRTQLEAMLKSGGPVPDAPFDGLEVLSPAVDFQNRHPSILLAFDATLAALEDAKATA